MTGRPLSKGSATVLDATVRDEVGIVQETGSEPAPRRRANVYGLITCQGDSLTYGSRDPDGMSYPLYLGRTLSQKHNQTWATVNLGVPGDGWAEIWRRNYHELLSVPEAKEVCLWAGTNDAKQNRSLEQTLIACAEREREVVESPPDVPGLPVDPHQLPKVRPQRVSRPQHPQEEMRGNVVFITKPPTSSKLRRGAPLRHGCYHPELLK